MVTILLEKIISLLEGWAGSFASFIIDLMTKLNLIETETANLPDIKTNTDNISSNTDSMTATLTNIKTDTGVISGKVNNIDSNTTIIKNNINTISTNVGTASAFCEDTANNTLEIVDKITTIASDTTQLRTNSNSISSDVSEIKNTLGLYLYNTIVTEDSEGAIANFDTDLKDYLQNAVVTIPADAGGIAEIFVVNQNTDYNKADKFRGLLLGNCKYITYDGSNDENWVLYTETGLNQISIPTPNIVSSTTEVKTANTKYTDIKISNRVNNYNTCYSGTSGICFNIQNITVAEWRDMLAADPITVIYNIATPITPTITKAQFESLSAAFGISLNDYTVTFGNPITDGAEVDLLSGIVKINTSPVTYDSITPLAIRTFKGVNNIYSDIGDMDVTYRETLKHYLEKQNS